MRWDPKDPVVAFDYYVNVPYGLQWQQDFSAEHGKPTAIGEWGVNSNTAGPFIEAAARWFEDHHMVYQNYWNSNAAFQGALSDGQYPEAGAVFQAIFGQGIDPYASDMTAIHLIGSAAVDLIIGHGGSDALAGGGSDDFLHGGSGNDILNGGAGDDLLDGGTGADTMTGGAGNDIYYVDASTDKVTEKQGATEGHDVVYASASYDLAATFVEELRLIGAGNLRADGNGQANALYGNAGNNILDGRSGADIMAGGAGNDTYYVDNARDKVIELQGMSQGQDTVYASVGHSLAGTFVETMWLTGSANIKAAGNDQANTIHGNIGNNVINGMGGNDILSGGGGKDSFVVAKAGRITISDFAAGDTLDLSAFLKGGKQISAAQSVDGAMLTIDSGTSILLDGLALSHLIRDGAGFHFV